MRVERISRPETYRRHIVNIFKKQAQLSAETFEDRKLWTVLKDTVADIIKEHGATVNTDLVVAYYATVDPEDDTQGTWTVFAIPVVTYSEWNTPKMTVAPDSPEGRQAIRQVVRQALAVQWAAE
jgi:hypothetical protein